MVMRSAAFGLAIELAARREDVGDALAERSLGEWLLVADELDALLAQYCPEMEDQRRRLRTGCRLNE